MSKMSNIKGARTAFLLPTHQPAAQLVQAAPVQNTWYTVLNAINVTLYSAALNNAGGLEDIEVRVTIDGNVFTHAIAAATDDFHFFYIAGSQPLNLGHNVFTTAFGSGVAPVLCRRLLVEMRKTSAVGAANLTGIVVWARW